MSEQKVYIIANLVIHKKDIYLNYEKGFFPLLKKYGGEFVTYDNQTEHFEGNSPIEGRLVIFTFPSPNLARDWYKDVEYQDLSKHRRSSTTLKNLTMVKSLPPRK